MLADCTNMAPAWVSVKRGVRAGSRLSSFKRMLFKGYGLGLGLVSTLTLTLTL